jgi:hypothetical protein
MMMTEQNARQFRSRLFFTGEIDDNWKYVGMLQNDQVIAQNGMDDNKTGSSVTKFQRAYLEGKFGDNLTITGGRFGTFIADGNVYDDRVDAIKAEIGKNIKFTAEYGKMANKDVVCNCKEHMDDMESLADKYYRLGLRR